MSPLTESTRVVLAKDFTWNESIWNPSMIQTALWLDAADASTVTTVSGAVSQWNDKSGNSRNATPPTTGQRPVYTAAGLNNRNIITFDGTDDTLNTSAFTFSSNQLATCCVFRTASTNTVGIWGGSFDPASNRLGLFFTGSNALRSMTFSSADANVAGYATDTFYIVSTSRTGSTAKQYRNGAEVAAATAGTSSPASMLISVGSFANNTVGSFPGDFAELVVFPSNDLSRYKTEGYLAHKWGLTANLPAGHPYKTVGPTP